jgi:hypothetical protein
MASFRSRQSEASLASAERRQREDRAPRLLAEVPFVASLRLEIEERRQNAAVPETVHIRHVAVAHAPAMFELPCLDTTCSGGGHDVTSAILRSLRSRLAKFEGEHACNGTTRTAPCTRVLRYVATATYRD